jgi:malate dehydrogenase
MDRLKIAVIGAGNIGASSAAAMVERGLGQVFLHDVDTDLAAGKAMDINHASAYFHNESRVVPCSALSDLDGARIVVIAAGAPRRIGMKRQDLLCENTATCLSIGEQIMTHCPDARVLIVTNPVDALTTRMKNEWPQLKVFGLGCTLDTIRLRYLLAEAAGARVDAVDAMVIGSHNDRMIPLIRYATIDGSPVSQRLSGEQIARAVDETRRAGHFIVEKLKSRGSFYAASFCVAAIVAAIARNRREVFPVNVRCEGQYGQYGPCLALPCIVGAAGAERIVELKLNDEELAALADCAADIRDAVDHPQHCPH